MIVVFQDSCANSADELAENLSVGSESVLHDVVHGVECDGSSDLVVMSDVNLGVEDISIRRESSKKDFLSTRYRPCPNESACTPADENSTHPGMTDRPCMP